MKAANRWITVLCAWAVMLALSTPALAIGFEAETAYRSVFVIYSGNALGSGFALGKNCIVTNAHVVEDAARIDVSTYDGDQYAAFAVAVDESLDIAILGVEGADFVPLPAADLSQVSVGDDAYAIGAPHSLSYSLTKGVISAKDRTFGRHSYIQTDTAINAGNSGGPLLSDAGEVIGVNTLKMSNSEGIGLSIPIGTVLDFLADRGIELDERGNVVGTVEPPESHPSRDDSAPGHGLLPAPAVPASPLLYALAIALGVSCLVNIFLVILLVSRKKKNIYLPPDPSQRTDFEIDILE